MMKEYKGPSKDHIAQSMPHTHELIKAQQPKDSEKLAIAALEKDTTERKRVEQAENTCRLLAKKGISEKEYRKKAQSLFPYSTFFKNASSK